MALSYAVSKLTLFPPRLAMFPTLLYASASDSSSLEFVRYRNSVIIIIIIRAFWFDSLFWTNQSVLSWNWSINSHVHHCRADDNANSTADVSWWYISAADIVDCCRVRSVSSWLHLILLAILYYGTLRHHIHLRWCRHLVMWLWQKFMEKLSELFECICCQELLYQPVTTECTHNFCKVHHYFHLHCRCVARTILHSVVF